MAHHGAGAIARCVNEIGDPDMAVESLAVEGLAGLKSQVELGDLG
jgi:hypothetical protein